MELECVKERKKRDWSQEKLAKEAGISRGTLVSLENGACKSMPTIKKVYSVLGLEPYLYYTEILGAKCKDRDKFEFGLLMIKQSL
jgi:transcriptional regulator with XRE-family HTH domain